MNDKKACSFLNHFKGYEEKPPLGVMPKYIWNRKRLSELKRAIQEYTQKNLMVPIEWVEEYNELLNGG